jgi:hypothetical protein
MVYNQNIIKCFIIVIVLSLYNCTSIQISNPKKNSIIAIESKDANCSESFRKKQFYLLFGTVPLNKVKQEEMFPDEKATYQIVEEATWVDFLISGMGGQLISLSSKTFQVKKCDGASLAKYNSELNAPIEEKNKKLEENLIKEYELKVSALNQDRIQFEKDKEALIKTEVEKISANRLSEIKDKQKPDPSIIPDNDKQEKFKELDQKKNDEVDKKKWEEEKESDLRKKLEQEYTNKSKIFQKEYAQKKETEYKQLLREKSEEIESDYFKKKEREVTISLEKYIASNKSSDTNSEFATLYLKKGTIVQGKIVKFESDFLNIEKNGEQKRYFIKEILKVVLPKRR